jgi:hypothetical protein
MLRVKAAGRLTSSANVKAVRNSNVNMLVRVFGDTWANYGEVLFLITAWRARIDKRVAAWD